MNLLHKHTILSVHYAYLYYSNYMIQDILCKINDLLDNEDEKEI